MNIYFTLQKKGVIAHLPFVVVDEDINNFINLG